MMRGLVGEDGRDLAFGDVDGAGFAEALAGDGGSFEEEIDGAGALFAFFVVGVGESLVDEAADEGEEAALVVLDGFAHGTAEIRGFGEGVDEGAAAVVAGFGALGEVVEEGDELGFGIVPYFVEVLVSADDPLVVSESQPF